MSQPNYRYEKVLRLEKQSETLFAMEAAAKRLAVKELRTAISTVKLELQNLHDSYCQNLEKDFDFVQQLKNTMDATHAKLQRLQAELETAESEWQLARQQLIQQKQKVEKFEFLHDRHIQNEAYKRRRVEGIQFMDAVNRHWLNDQDSAQGNESHG